MGNHEVPSQEGMGDSAKQEKNKEFAITFPDGTIGKFKSQEEAIEAMQAWREAA